MRSGQPVATIILPVFNAESYLPDALRRLRRQTMGDFELIIVDDCSVDGTAAVADAQAAVDSRIKVLRQPHNRGVSEARNLAVDSARGRFIWFVDVDDEWSDDFLKVMVDAALRTSADLTVCTATHRYGRQGKSVEDVVRYHDSRELVGFDAVECILLGSGALWNKLFRYEVLGTSPFPALRSKSDHGGVLRVMPAVSRLTTVPDSLYTYVQRDGSISNGSIPQPQNFLRLLDIAEESLRSYDSSPEIESLRARFRTHIVARALRESWRFPYQSSGIVASLPSMVTWRDLRLTASTDRRAFITCGAAKISPPLARRAFRFIGRRRWTSHGAQ